MFCSDIPVDRAIAYQTIGEYLDYENLDSYPIRFSHREDVEARYAEKEQA